MSKKEDCSEALEKLADFLNKYSPIINVCMVDFVTDDIFATCLSDALGLELLALEESEIANLPQRLLKLNSEIKSQEAGLTSSFNEKKEFSEIDKLLKEISFLSIDNLESTLSLQDLELKLAPKKDEKNLLTNFDRIMGEKKMHEVVILSNIVNRINKGDFN